MTHGIINVALHFSLNKTKKGAELLLHHCYSVPLLSLLYYY